MPTAPTEFLQRLYDRFNARDIETVGHMFRLENELLKRFDIQQ